MKIFTKFIDRKKDLLYCRKNKMVEKIENLIPHRPPFYS